MSHGSRQKFARTFRRSSCKWGVFLVFRISGGFFVSCSRKPYRTSPPRESESPQIRQKQDVKIPKFSRIFKSKRLPKVKIISPKVNLNFPIVLEFLFQNFVWGAHSHRASKKSKFLGLVAPYRAILRYYRCNFLRAVRAPQKGAIPPPLLLCFTQVQLCDTPFATYPAISVRYPIKTNTNEFCDTMATTSDFSGRPWRNLAPTWVIHMATRRQTHNTPIHMNFLYGFFKKDGSPCGSACCGLVCGSPCG